MPKKLAKKALLGRQHDPDARAWAHAEFQETASHGPRLAVEIRIAQRFLCPIRCGGDTGGSDLDACGDGQPRASISVAASIGSVTGG